MIRLLVPYVVIALLAGGGGVAAGWVAHPGGVEQRSFHGVVTTVDIDQKAVAVDTTEYGKVAGMLVNDGPPIKVGETVDGVLYGDDAQIVEVVPPAPGE